MRSGYIWGPALTHFRSGPCEETAAAIGWRSKLRSYQFIKIALLRAPPHTNEVSLMLDPATIISPLLQTRGNSILGRIQKQEAHLDIGTNLEEGKTALQIHILLFIAADDVWVHQNKVLLPPNP
jgi:hypothetical protein